ncbi:E3 ubiquitin-protein ligase RNF25 [Oryza brachyantha]|uniref:RWD domain-containing protein n=1 Tax=Oryza brachyantha TaxID=4533 RepID=J3N928_ORYBR|nr:E3 ubiquitin-protein ligase RNF25 [Oryza brachyantha]
MAAEAEAEAEEEVRQEVEAVVSVYGGDCRVVRGSPPHLVVHVRPRTADDSSRQFVELFLGIKASSQYPKEPPHVYSVESKGLDENRQIYLISSIQNKAKELSCYPMLVTLCEEAVEILSNMNHPAGDCPLCLYPLVQEDKDGSTLPFMKLMSCYHCFHSDCIMKWWEWLQNVDTDSKKSNTAVTTEVIHASEGLDLSSSAKHHNVSQHKGLCPVCRKVFDEKDIEHVSDLLGANTSKLASLTIDLDEDEKELLHSESEKNRREKFASLFNLQQQRNGLIEPKKDLSIQPGMYIPRPPSMPTAAEEATIDDSCKDTTTSTSEVEPHSQTNSTGSTTKHNSNSGHRRRHRSHASRRQPPHGQPVRQQWQRKGGGTSQQ